MKKKLLTVTVGICLMLTFAGCGAKETASNENVAETVVEVAEETTEYGTEETTEVVEETTETVVEEQTTETTETVEETVVEETTEEVAEAVAFLDESIDWPEGYPKVFINDDPRTSDVTDLYAGLGVEFKLGDAKMYFWNQGASPAVNIQPGTESFEELKVYMYDDSVSQVSYFGTVLTDEGEKEVLLLIDEDNPSFPIYSYTLGDYTIGIQETDEFIKTIEDLQVYVDLIRFE